MHFRVLTDEMNFGLGMVIRAVSARPVKQAYDGVLIETTDDGLMLTCTDGEISIKAQVSAQVEEDGRVSKLEVDPSIPRLPCTYLETFCIRRELLIHLVDEAVSQGHHHLTRELLMDAINTQSLKVMGFANPGRAWQLDSVQAYFDCSMELLDQDPDLMEAAKNAGVAFFGVTHGVTSAEALAAYPHEAISGTLETALALARG